MKFTRATLYTLTILFLSFSGSVSGQTCNITYTDLVTNPSCNGGNDGSITINGLSDGSTGDGRLGVQYTCEDGTLVNPGSTLYVGPGEVKRIYGSYFFSSLVIDGGTLIVCEGSSRAYQDFEIKNGGTLYTIGSLTIDPSFNIPSDCKIVNTRGTITTYGTVDCYGLIYNINGSGNAMGQLNVYGEVVNWTTFGSNYLHIFNGGSVEHHGDWDSRDATTGSVVIDNGGTFSFHGDETAVDMANLTLNGTINFEGGADACFKVGNIFSASSTGTIITAENIDFHFNGTLPTGVTAGSSLNQVSGGLECRKIPMPVNENALFGNGIGSGGTCNVSWSTGATGNQITGLSAGITYTATFTCGSCTSTKDYVLTNPAVLTIDLVSKTKTSSTGCNGGVDVTVAGGTPSYSFSWVRVIDGQEVSLLEDLVNVCEGTYKLTVTDANGCLVTQTYQVEKETSNNCGDDLIITSNDPTCNGGSNGSILVNTDAFETNTGNCNNNNGNVCGTPNAPNISCATCDQTLSGGWASVGAGQKCIDNTFTGSVGMWGGKLVICGDNVVMNNIDASGGEIIILGNLTIESLNTTGSNTKIINYGTLKVNNTLSFRGTFENNGSVVVTGIFPVNYSTASLENNGTINCYYFENNNLVTNNGIISTVYDVNNNHAGVFTNNCTVISGNNFDNNYIFKNYGSLTVPQKSHLVDHSVLELYEGSLFETRDMDFYGEIAGKGTGCAQLKINNTVELITSYELSGNVNVCMSGEDKILGTGYHGNWNLSCGCSLNANTNNGNNTATCSKSCVFKWTNLSTGEVLSYNGNNPTNLIAGDYEYNMVCEGSCSHSGVVTLNGSSTNGFNATVTTTNVQDGNCDGSMSVQVEGAIGEVVYDWIGVQNASDLTDESSLTDLCAGVYKVRITDEAGCVIEVEGIVGKSTECPLTIVDQITDANCPEIHNGSISLTVTGLNAGDNYFWLNSSGVKFAIGETEVSDLAAGTYAFVVEGINCSFNKEYLVKNIVPVCPCEQLITFDSEVLGATVDDCRGSITLSNISGNVTSIVWSNGVTGTESISGLCAGNYSVTLSSTSCDRLINFSVPVLNGCDAILVDQTVTNATCGNSSDGSVSLNISGVSAVQHSCYQETVVPLEDCQSCDQYLSGSGYYTVDGGQKYCVLAGQNFSGTVTVNNGKFVSEGDLSGGVSLTLGTNGEAYLKGNTTINYFSDWGQNAKLYNYGELTTGQTLSPQKKLYNYGKINFTSNGQTGWGSEFYNYGEISTAQTFTSGGKLFNYGVLDATTLTVQGQSFDNYCTVNAGSMSSSIVWSNNGQVKITGNVTTSSASGITLAEGSLWEIGGDLSLNLDLNGPTADYAFLKVEGNLTTTWGVDLTGKIKVCNVDLSSMSGLGAEVIESCEFGGDCAVTWSNGSTGPTLSNVVPGVYDYTLNCPGGCNKTGSVTVGGPTPLVVNVNSIDASCVSKCDGELSVNVTGGKSPFSYNWQGDGAGQQNPTIIKACAGTYGIIVTDGNGCSESLAGITLNAIENDPKVCAPECENVALATFVTDASCPNIQDGQVAVDVTDGTNDYSFELVGSGQSNIVQNTSAYTFQNLAEGVYSVKVKDGLGCDVSKVVSVGITANDCGGTVCDGFDLNIDKTPASCEKKADGAITVSASSGTGLNYVWSDLASNNNPSTRNGLPIGVYNVKVTSSEGCFDEESIILTYTNDECEPDVVTGKKCEDFAASIINAQNPICASSTVGSITVDYSGQVGNVDLSWQKTSSNNGTIIGASQAITNPYTIGDLSPGTYDLVVKDANSCVAKLTHKLSGYNTICGDCDFTVVESIQGTSDDCTCDGGINLTVSDPNAATSTYDFLWSNGSITKDIANQCPGDYWVKVVKTAADGSTCEQTLNFSISPNGSGCGIYTTDCSNNPIVITPNSNDASCGQKADGWIDLTVSGNKGGYTFLWNTGTSTEDLHHLQAGDYEVTVKSAAGCEAKKTITINNSTPDCDPQTIPTKDTVLAIITKSTCPGSYDGKIDLSVIHFGAGAPYSYLWNTGAITQDLPSVVAGAYNVLIIDKEGNSAQFDYNVDYENATCPDIITNKACNEIEPQIQVITKKTSGENTCDGAASIIMNNAYGVYTYEWTKIGETDVISTSNSINSACEGAYKVVVTNGTCTFTKSIIILPGDEVIGTGVCKVYDVVSNASCPNYDDGQITLMTVGGQGPYTYKWEPSGNTQQLSGLVAGEYTVIVEGTKNCRTVKTFSIDRNFNNCQECESFNPSISVNKKSSCTNTETVLEVQPAGKSYYWTTNETTKDIVVNKSGTYSVTVGEGNCEKQVSVTVEAISDIPTDVSIIASGKTICNNGNITLSADVIGSSYLWSTGETTESIVVNTAGWYSVKVVLDDDGVCSLLSDEIYIDQNNKNVQIDASSLEVCEGSPVVLRSNYAAGNEWLLDGNVISNDAFVLAKKPGNYQLTASTGECGVQMAAAFLIAGTNCTETNEVIEKQACDPLFGTENQLSISSLSCSDFYKSVAEYNASKAYEVYLEGLRNDFRLNYIKKCMDVQESFVINQDRAEKEHHYTLYYYDNAGSLVRTVPPKGVVPLTPDEIDQVEQDVANSERTLFTEHSYASTYQFNSLNQLIGSSVPDNELMDISTIQTASSSDADFVGATWNGAYLTEQGNGVLFGEKGGDGVLFHTNDNGLTWEPITGLGVQNLNDVFFLNDNDVFISGEKGTLLKSNDAGATWKTVSVGAVDYNLVKTYFVTANSGYVVTEGGIVYYTSDGGSSWSAEIGLMNKVAGKEMTDIEFVDVNTAYAAVTQNGITSVFETIDGASTWTEVEFGLAQINNIHSNGSNGWVAVDNGNLFDLTSGTNVATGTIKNLVEVASVSDKVFAKSDDNKLILHDLSSNETQEGGSIVSVVPNNTNTEVAVINGSSYYYHTIGSSYGAVTFAQGVTADGASFENYSNYLYWQANNLYASHNVSSSIFTGGASIDAAHLHTSGSNKLITVVEGGNIHFFNGSTWSIPQSSVGSFVNDWWNGAEGLILTSSKLLSTSDNGATWSVLSTNVGGLTSIGEFNNEVVAGDANGDWYVLNTATSNFDNNFFALGAAKINDLVVDGANVLAIGDNQSVYELSANKFKSVTRNGTTNLKKGVYQSATLTAVSETGAVVKGAITSLSTSNNSFNTNGDKHDVRDLARSGNFVYATIYNQEGVPENNQTMAKVDVNTTNNWDNTDTYNVGIPTLSAIGINSVNKAVLVGEGGALYTNSDVTTSNSWTLSSTIGSFEMADAQMVTTSVGYAVGNTGNVLKTEDGGLTWEFMAVPLTEDWKSVHFFNATHGVVISSTEVIYTNNGSSWNSLGVSASAGTIFNDVAMSSITKAFIAGEQAGGGTVFEINTASNTMSAVVINGAPEALKAIDVAKPFTAPGGGTVYSSGNNGTLVMFDGGLNSWDELVSPNNQRWTDELLLPITDFNDIQFTDYITGYAVGSDGRILKTTNAGQSWFSFDMGQSMDDIVSVDFKNETNGLVVTASGVEQFEDLTNRFSARFWYDELGRIVLSQNTRQYNKSTPAYSYTIYDELGRVIEVGEIATNQNINSLVSSIHPSQIKTTSSQPVSSFYPQNIGSESAIPFWSFIQSGNKTEVTRTYYDDIASVAGSSGALFNYDPEEYRKNTRNRIATVSYMPNWVVNEFSNSNYRNAYTSSINYDYDIHGNVKTIVADYGRSVFTSGSTITDDMWGDLIRTDYKYDLISGNVIETIYQEGKPDEMHHKFEYDADNRIKSVYTSTDGVNWENDASYHYYKHGPLARVEIGDVNVQACDYAYTIQGWMKGVNSNTLSPNDDMGNDNGTTFAKDEFAFSLGYFDGDYASISGATPFKAITGAGYTNNQIDMFNGNISNRVNAIGKFINNGESPTATLYAYDQLNRLQQAQQLSAVGDLSNKFKTTYNYDANGNILDLQRYDGNGDLMDDFAYRYEDISTGFKRNTNKLRAVQDAVTTTGSLGYSDLQHGQLWNNNGSHDDDNYAYDAIGNLIKDTQEGIANIEWRVDGKIAAVRGMDGTDQPDVEFKYDPMGNRISKLVKPRDPVTGLKPLSAWKETVYTRDAQGNVMAIYETKYSDIDPVNFIYKAETALKEHSIYGSSRLGIKNTNEVISEQELQYSSDQNDYMPNGSGIPNIVAGLSATARGQKVYELSDHLGNVNVTVTDQKFEDNGLFTAVVASASEVYPFGMTKPGRSYQSESYRYGFNGKERDLEGIGGGGSTYDYGFRIYNPQIAKFLSVDPLSESFPWYTPYQFAGSKPIIAIDLDGLEEYIIVLFVDNGKLLGGTIHRVSKEEYIKSIDRDIQRQVQDLEKQKLINNKIGDKKSRKLLNKNIDKQISNLTSVERDARVKQMEEDYNKVLVEVRPKPGALNPQNGFSAQKNVSNEIQGSQSEFVRGKELTEKENLDKRTSLILSEGLTNGSKLSKNDLIHYQSYQKHGQIRFRVPDALKANFETNSAVLSAEDKKTLDNLYIAMMLVPDLNITFVGHTDQVGSPESNIRLSKRRAEAAVNYLSSNGIDKSRLTAVGKGDTEPIEDTGAASSVNRRIEVIQQ